MGQKNTEKKKLIIFIVLGALAVLSVVRGIFTPSAIRRDLASTPAQTVQKTEPAATRLATSPSARSAKKSKYNTWGRNPFVAATIPGEPAGELKLGGILWDKDKPVAIINDNMAGIGDTVGAYKVVGITQDSVTLNDGTEEHILKLGF